MSASILSVDQKKMGRAHLGRWARLGLFGWVRLAPFGPIFNFSSSVEQIYFAFVLKGRQTGRGHMLGSVYPTLLAPLLLLA